MLDVFQIAHWTDVIVIVAWALVIWGLGFALFRSFWAQELRYWWISRDSTEIAQIRRLEWEVANRAHWNPEAAREPHSEFAAAKKLTSDEWAERRRRLHALVRGSVFRRAAAYAADCGFCQRWWLAFTLLIVQRIGSDGWCALWPSFCSAFLYATIGNLLDKALGSKTEAARPARSRCPGCR